VLVFSCAHFLFGEFFDSVNRCKYNIVDRRISRTAFQMLQTLGIENQIRGHGKPYAPKICFLRDVT